MKNISSYTVSPTADPMAIDGSWDGPAWRAVPALPVSRFMGDAPAHQPDTQVKLLYDHDAIHVIFKVEDRYVRAVHGHQGPVCRDSCVEFFFVPGGDTSTGYFNLETNCGGNMLFHHQIQPRGKSTTIARPDCDRISLYHSLPSKVDPEIGEPVTWTLQYRLPVDLLARYAPFVPPACGVRWRANFYKCADETSHPHWLTWSEVHRPSPDFHVPEDFGELIFG